MKRMDQSCLGKAGLSSIFILLGVMRKYIGYIAILCAVFFSVLYVGKQKPELMNQLLISIDVFGLTEVGEKEQLRIAEINQLILFDEQRQALINRTVFMGATTRMVYLALGEPKQKKDRPASANRKAVIIWIYHFPNDNRPTILEFEPADKIPDGEVNPPYILVSAYKGSVLDMVK